jgi:hypothetical protein
MHYVKQRRGVKNFDVWSFYAQHDDWPFPPRCRGDCMRASQAGSVTWMQVAGPRPKKRSQSSCAANARQRRRRTLSGR